MYPLKDIAQAVKRSLTEDVGRQDITALLISKEQQALATLIVREEALICGIPWFTEVYRQVDPNLCLKWAVKEGDFVKPNQNILSLEGSARSMVTGERTAINWLQTLSGTATVTHQVVQKLRGKKTCLLDTRKTIPGLRDAQKYAVRVGGAENHRMGLYDAFLIKENHIAACGGLHAAIHKARTLYPEKFLEVEVETLQELEEALSLKVDRIMLDNFSLEDIKIAIDLTQGKIPLEVSGDIDLQRAQILCEWGIDFISMGSLTKHLKAIDFSLRIHLS